MNAFQFQQKVLFRHCDPARIMFFPRMLEVVNDAVESFFENALEWPFHEFHPDWGAPTAEISTRFIAPCRFAETLTLSIVPTRVGAKSLTLKTSCSVEGDPRFETIQTLVCVGATGKSNPWPEDVRKRAEKLLETKT